MKLTESQITYRETQDLITNEFGDYFEFLGAKRLLGRIFGLLIANSKPVSLKEIAEKLKISKPAISTTIKYGMQTEMFKKVYVPENPREYFYTMGIDFMEMMIDPGLKKMQMFIDRISDVIKFVENSGSLNAKDADLMELYERLKYLEKAFGIVLGEYHIFGKRVRQKLSDLRDNIDSTSVRLRCGE